ncbi:MAG TPA: hypothetical protein VHZ76_00710 [Gammaproteobacteria bacterium]|nr:hypothetical protein [Gammaproteobacteria bacterium]
MICRKEIFKQAEKDYSNMISFRLPYGGVEASNEYRSFMSAKDVYEQLGCQCGKCENPEALKKSNKKDKNHDA